MRGLPLVFLSIVAIAGTSDQPGPKLPAPRILNLNFKPIAKSKAPDKFFINSPMSFDERMESRTRPRLDLPFIPYPNQVPSRYKGIFYAN